MVVAIAELSDVLMQMAKGDFVVLADDAALQQSPESFDCVGVNLAIGIGEFMIDRAMRHEGFEPDVSLVFVSNENRVSAVDVFAYQFCEALMFQLGLVNWLSDDPPATFNHADYWHLFRGTRTHSPLTITLARLPADKGFVHFHDTFEQFALLKHSVANPHPHVPRGILIHFQIAGQLASGKPFFGVQNERDRQKPFLQG